MKKILLAFDGTNFSTGALEFAAHLNKQSPVFLTGAFLPQADFANLWSFSGGAGKGKEFIPLLEQEDSDAVRANIGKFTSFCIEHQIDHAVHKDYFDFAIPELKKESRFADLLIVSSERFYEQAGTETPNEYLKEAIHGMECPVIAIPEQSAFPTSIILAYDGSASSVFAIKQFAYLFPELAGTCKTILVYANEHNDKPVPHEENIAELVLKHYPRLETVKLDANPKKFFATWLGDKKGSIVVSGAYGRSDLSRMFRESFVNSIIGEHRVAVFAAHK